MSKDLMALGALLDKERTCLLNGDLSGALDLADQKASLADSVENITGRSRERSCGGLAWASVPGQ